MKALILTVSSIHPNDVCARCEYALNRMKKFTIVFCVSTRVLSIAIAVVIVFVHTMNRGMFIVCRRVKKNNNLSLRKAAGGNRIIQSKVNEVRCDRFDK